ncbi:hypothetical protein OROGR_003321 [Orobanche gracilis]
MSYDSAGVAAVVSDETTNTLYDETTNTLFDMWDYMGESDSERTQRLTELEQECLRVCGGSHQKRLEFYKRRVRETNELLLELIDKVEDYEVELSDICIAMCEDPLGIPESVIQNPRPTLKEQLAVLVPQVEEMRNRRRERVKLFETVIEQVQVKENKAAELSGRRPRVTCLDEKLLSLKDLQKIQNRLPFIGLNREQFQEKIDCKTIVAELQPNLCRGVDDNSKYIVTNSNNDTENLLAASINKYQEEKIQIMKKLQVVVTTMLELWNFLDTPSEEQQLFEHVTCYVAAAAVNEHAQKAYELPGILSLDCLNNVETENSHSGVVDPGSVLEQIEFQIANAKEELYSGNDIVERVGKWLLAREEETWLEEYNRDVDRYRAGRDAYLNLKRAEEARAWSDKLPAMVEVLASETMSWEKERGVDFTYDGSSLLAMLGTYTIVRQVKKRELERQGGQLIAGQESRSDSKVRPSKPLRKKAPRMSTGGATNRGVSLGGATKKTPKRHSLYSTRATPNTHTAKKNERFHCSDKLNHRQDDGLAGGPSPGCLDWIWMRWKLEIGEILIEQDPIRVGLGPLG